jgi:hypothetical protein
MYFWVSNLTKNCKQLSLFNENNLDNCYPYLGNEMYTNKALVISNLVNKMYPTY